MHRFERFFEQKICLCGGSRPTDFCPWFWKYIMCNFLSFTITLAKMHRFFSQNVCRSKDPKPVDFGANRISGFGIVVYLTSSCVKLGFKGLRVPKKPNLHTKELNTTFFCSTSALKASNGLKSLKLA
jgi:hypothetical protein